MNEFMCRNYLREEILNDLSRIKRNEYGNDSTPTWRFEGREERNKNGTNEGSFRRLLMRDVGSKRYKSWLKRIIPSYYGSYSYKPPDLTETINQDLPESSYGEGEPPSQYHESEESNGGFGEPPKEIPPEEVNLNNNNGNGHDGGNNEDHGEAGDDDKKSQEEKPPFDVGTYTYTMYGQPPDSHSIPWSYDGIHYYPAENDDHHYFYPHHEEAVEYEEGESSENSEEDSKEEEETANDLIEAKTEEFYNFLLTIASFLAFGFFTANMLGEATQSANGATLMMSPSSIPSIPSFDPSSFTPPIPQSAPVGRDPTRPNSKKPRSDNDTNIASMRELNELSGVILTSIDRANRLVLSNGEKACDFNAGLCRDSAYSRTKSNFVKIWLPIWNVAIGWIANKNSHISIWENVADSVKAVVAGIEGKCEMFYAECKTKESL